ncbi:MAG TPA: putative phage abortive infection protein [Prolixibacteraceae bacterium]|nr:putative phage abortive infection protein [Prolixibacteraceae bacterium]
MKRFLNKNIIPFSFFLMIIGISIIAFATTKTPFNDWSFKIDPELSGQFGSFIGGIVGSLFSLVAALLLYKTLMTQVKTLKQQKKGLKRQKIASRIESFETTFFNLLSTQQEIRNTIKTYTFTLNENISIKRSDANGREFFAYSTIELKNLWLCINSTKYLGQHNSQSADSFNNQIEDIKDENSVNYIAIPDDFESAKSQLFIQEELKFTNHFYGITNDIWVKAQDSNTIEKIKLIYGLFFQKYHSAIGHYYRHLYHIINYTDLHFQMSSQLSENSAKKYIDFIQAQMSSYEMMLLFYNSVSFPKLLRLLVKYNFLENLAFEDLIDQSHNCIEGINLKSRRNLI